MRLSLIGMAGTGKSHWSAKLSAQGFKRYGCDDLIAGKLTGMLKRPDGSTMRMGEWMGFPFEAGHKARETRYLALELEVMRDLIERLEIAKGEANEHVVIDTTGSVIYTGDPVMRRLKRQTTVVYLATPPDVEAQLLDAYVRQPHPMVWRHSFSKKPHESNRDALARCYPILLSDRRKRYAQYADVSVDFHQCREAGFGPHDFLALIREHAKKHEKA